MNTDDLINKILSYTQYGICGIFVIVILTIIGFLGANEMPKNGFEILVGAFKGLIVLTIAAVALISFGAAISFSANSIRKIFYKRGP